MNAKLMFVLKQIHKNPQPPIQLMIALVNMNVKYDSEDYYSVIRYLHSNVSQEYSDLVHEAFFRYSHRTNRKKVVEKS